MIFSVFKPLGFVAWLFEQAKKIKIEKDRESLIVVLASFQINKKCF
jgi:hypothetical protein